MGRKKEERKLAGRLRNRWIIQKRLWFRLNDNNVWARVNRYALYHEHGTVPYKLLEGKCSDCSDIAPDHLKIQLDLLNGT